MIKNTVDELINSLKILADGLSAANPVLEKLLAEAETALFGEAAFALRANFHNEKSVRDEQECERRIRLVADAIESGLSEEAALKVLYTVYGKEPLPEKEFSAVGVALDRAMPLLEALVTGLASRRSAPFPSTLPNLNEVMKTAGWAASGGTE